MPTYDYACAACGHRFEVVHGVHAQGPESCPVCAGGPVRKAIAAPTFLFKGSGWAKMDRRSAASPSRSAHDDAGTKTNESGAKPAEAGPKPSESGTAASATGSKAAPDGGSDAGATKSKPESGPKTASATSD